MMKNKLIYSKENEIVNLFKLIVIIAYVIKYFMTNNIK